MAGVDKAANMEVEPLPIIIRYVVEICKLKRDDYIAAAI